MLNILPQLTGYLVARHLKISYTAGLDLAYIAFWNGFRIDRVVSNWPKERGRSLLFLRTAGLSIRLERLHNCLEMRISRDGRTPKMIQDLRDIREVLEATRTLVENYQRPTRAWWAVVPIDQYRSIKFQ